MALESYAFPLQDETYSAAITRRGIFVGLAPDASNDLGSIAGGIRNKANGDFLCTAPNSGMSVNIAAGEAMVPGSYVTTNSGYYVFGSSTTSVAVSTSDPSNGRIDVPCLTVNDQAYGSGSDGAIAQVIKGTASGSPVAPSLPSSSLALSHVSVPAAATNIVSADFTDERVQLALGINVTLTAAEVEATMAGNPRAVYVGTLSGGELLQAPTGSGYVLQSGGSDASGLEWATINPNLLFNSSGERGPSNCQNDIDGWTNSGGSWYADSIASDLWDFAPMSPGGIVDEGNNSASETLTSASIVATNGQQFTLSGWAQTSGTSQGTSYLKIQTYNGTSWSDLCSASIPANTTKAFYSCSGTTPSGTTKLRVQIVSAEGSASTSNNFWQLKLESGSLATPWSPSAVGPGWTAFTPTIGGSGWSVGNATNVGYFRMIDAKTMAVAYYFIVGSTTTVGSGSLTLGLPAGVSSSGNINQSGTCLFSKSGTGQFAGSALVSAAGTSIEPLVPTSSSNGLLIGVSSTLGAPSGSYVYYQGIIDLA